MKSIVNNLRDPRSHERGTSDYGITDILLVLQSQELSNSKRSPSLFYFTPFNYLSLDSRALLLSLTVPVKRAC